MPRRVILALPALVVYAGVSLAQGPFTNFETPPVHPVEMTPDGTRLLVVNTPDARIEVFSLTGALPVWIASIPVGLEPVSVRARTNSEIWVANQISDSVSIVNLTAMNVTSTLSVGDAPTDVVFAGAPQRAYVCISRQNQLKMYDPASLSTPPVVVPLAGANPRSLATDGARVFAAFFESGNRSIILPPSIVSNPAGPYAGVNPPPNSGALFNPPIAAGLPAPPPVGLIVNKEGANWRDDNQHIWDALVPWNLNEHDVAIVDTTNLSVAYANNLHNLGMSLSVQPVTGKVALVGTYDINEHRFEPTVRAKFIRVRIAVFNPLQPATTVGILDLNPNLDYSVNSIPQAQRNLSLSDPRAIAWNAAGTFAYISGMGSNNVIKTNLVQTGIFFATRNATIPVGQGPTGLAMDTPRSRLYCLNRFDGNVSVINTTNDTEIARVQFYDPTPQVIKDGRPFLYDAHATSGLGFVSCASCHVDATSDQQAWDLGDPSGAMLPFNQNCNGALPVVGACGSWHPMKGPMMTQTLIGTVGEEPLHWRGDRPDTASFTVGFTGLLGAAAPPTLVEMDKLKNFIATIKPPPNPNRTFNDGLPATVPGYVGNPLNGQALFTSGPVAAGSITCFGCHSSPAGDQPIIIAAGVLGESQSYKPAPLRNLYIQAGLSFTSTSNNRGFGYLHDGSADSVFNLLANHMAVFAAGQAGIDQRRDLEAFLMCFPTGTHPATGVQLTIDGTNKNDSVVISTLGTMTSLADAGVVGLIAKGAVGGAPRGYAYIAGSGALQSDRRSETVAALTLRLGAVAGGEITFTIVPAGSQVRLGIDRDLDNAYDRDEIDHATNPADPLSFPPPCSSDLNGDGSVGASDLAQLLGAWGTPGPGDIHTDGVVNSADLAQLLGAWGACP